jgi:hypothetical protein
MLTPYGKPSSCSLLGIPATVCYHHNMRLSLLVLITGCLWAVEPCIKCHPSFAQPQVVREKQTAMIRSVRSNQMPPGIKLSDAQKQQLIQLIIRKAQTK